MLRRINANLFQWSSCQHIGKGKLLLYQQELMIRDLATAIIRDGKVPTYWEQSFIVCLYKGKGDALDRGNYRGLKLTEQAMKIIERTGGVY